MTRLKLYSILLIACLAGYVWLFWVLFQVDNNAEGFSVCLFKTVTHIPCPSCGTSRSLVTLLHGNFIEALYLNPLGYIIAAIMLSMPLWLLYDMVFSKQTLFIKYHQMEYYLKKPLFFIPLSLLILLNWIWNSMKCI